MLNSVHAEEAKLIQLLRSNKVSEAKALLFSKVAEKKGAEGAELLKNLLGIVIVSALQMSDADREQFDDPEAWERFTNEFTIPEIKAYVDQKDEDGRTALHYAAALRDVESVLLLVALGATRGIRNKYHNTPAQYAIKKCPEYTGDQSHDEYVTNFAPNLISVLRIILQNKNRCWNKKHCLLQNKQSETVVHTLMRHSIGAGVLANLVQSGMPYNLELRDKNGFSAQDILEQKKNKLEETCGNDAYHRIADSTVLTGLINRVQKEGNNREEVLAQLRNFDTNQY